MIRVDGVQSAEVPLIWPSILEFLYRIIDHADDLDLGTIRRRLLARELQLWLVTEGKQNLGIFVTEIKPPILLLAMLGGRDVEKWLGDVIKVAEAYGAEHDCQCVEAIGRPGWRKFHKQMGFRHTYSVFRKEIDHAKAIRPVARHANQ